MSIARLIRAIIILALPLLILYTLANAQRSRDRSCTTCPGIGPEPNIKTPKRPRPPPVRIVIPRPVYIQFQKNVGQLLIDSEPGASVTILSSDDGKIVKEDKVPLGRNSLMYEVEPSKYLIRAKLDGYTDAEGSCDVGRGKPCTVRVKPVLKTYDVTLKLNIDGGTVIYRREDGLSISNSQQEVQGKSVTLHNLRPGKYTVTVKADDATYRPKIETIDVTDRNTNFTLSLERQVSGPFAWSVSSDWKLPASWHTDANRIISGGQGVALPSRDDYHYYLDFQLSTKVRMADGVAVSFIVHAVDLNNFYLVQLTGPKGEVPYRLRGFIVKDGVYQPFGLVINIEQFSQSLKPDSFFDVLLTMKDNKISVKLPDPETGEGLLPAGDLLDQSRTFPKGAVGVAVLNNERIEIGQFDICAANCQ